MVRVIGAAVFCVALAAGSIAAPGGADPPRRTHGSYVVLAGDFHVHAFPLDGALPWWEIAHEARRRGLDVVAITDHNRVVFRLKAEATGSSLGPETLGPGSILGRVASGFSRKIILIPGEEVTTPTGHIIAVGVTEPVGWLGAAPDIIARIHAQGGVAIAAHPIVDESRAFDNATAAMLDGAEAAHPVMFTRDGYRAELHEFYDRAARLKPGLAAIGSDDFHFWEPLGFCRTYLFVTSTDTAGVLDAIRGGRTVACDATGAVYGPKDLADIAAPFCAFDMQQALHTNNRVRTAAALVALLALALVAIG